MSPKCAQDLLGETGQRFLLSGLLEYFVGADTAPHDVRFAWSYGLAVLKGRAPVISPRHLKDSFGTFDPFDTQSFAKDSSSSEIVNEMSDGNQEERLLLSSKSVKVFSETIEPRVGRQLWLRLLAPARR